MKTKKLEILSILLMSLLMMTGSIILAQNNGVQQYLTLEDLEDKNIINFTRIYQIVDDYPDFKYKYVYKNGEVTDVEIEGVDNAMERKRLSVLIFDYKKNKEHIKNMPNRTGVYYSVDQPAEPKEGYQEFYNSLYNSIEYPEEAKNWGTEGNVYVQFVVKKNGEIGHIMTTENIESTEERFVKDLKKTAKEAVKVTSGEWKPAFIDDTPVDSWVVLPVMFRLEAHPGMVQMVR
jgi:hypothetical protein